MSLQCSQCSAEIVGRYYADPNGSVFCFSCYREMNKCMICGGFLKEHYEINSYKICVSCYKKALYRCTVCDLPVKRSTRRSSGEYVCDFCFEHGLTERKTLDDLAAKTRRFLSERLGMVIESEVAIEIKDRITSSSWYARSAVGEAEKRGSEYSIRLKRFSAMKNVQYFLVHEMTHIWQYENDFDGEGKNLKRLMEGLACWAESKYAERLSERQWIEHLREDPNPVYGDGFRFVAALEVKYGMLAVPGIALQIAKSLKSQD